MQYLQESRNNVNYESDLTALGICKKSAQICKFKNPKKYFQLCILFALEKSSNQRSAYSKTTILTALSKVIKCILESDNFKL